MARRWRKRLCSFSFGVSILVKCQSRAKSPSSKSPAESGGSCEKGKGLSNDKAASKEGAKTLSKDGRASKERTNEKEKQEDTFDKIQPKAQDTKRKEEIRGKKAENKGDYKTWNKVIENSEFNKTLSDKEKDEKKEESKVEKTK